MSIICSATCNACVERVDEFSFILRNNEGVETSKKDEPLVSFLLEGLEDDLCCNDGTLSSIVELSRSKFSLDKYSSRFSIFAK